MTETHYPTCEERIEDSLKGRLDDLRGFLQGGGEYRLTCQSCDHVWCTDDEYEECPECGEDSEDGVIVEDSENDGPFNEYGLELQKRYTLWRYLLSTGGPADGFDLYIDPETKEIDAIDYFFQDWWDGARRELKGEELDVAKELFEREFYFGD